MDKVRDLTGATYQGSSRGPIKRRVRKDDLFTHDKLAKGRDLMKRYEKRHCGNEFIEKPIVQVEKSRKEIFDIEKALSSIEFTKMFGNEGGVPSKDKKNQRWPTIEELRSKSE